MGLVTAPLVRGVWPANSGGFPGVALGRIAGQDGRLKVEDVSDCRLFKMLADMILRCCYITVASATTALQNGACTYRCISKQMDSKTNFSYNIYMKSLEFYESYITMFLLEKKNNFLTILY